METKFYYSEYPQVYTAVWSKYRPAVIQLMIGSDEGPQQYKFFDHEFKMLNPKEKKYSFELEVFKGKALKSIKGSLNAQDLLNMLNVSKKASELMSENRYIFNLDKNFILHVTKVQEVEVPEVVDAE